MNDPLPPPEPERLPRYEPPNFWLMCGVGIVVLVVSGLLCGACDSVLPAAIGLFVAVTSIFFRGWRGIFAGYFGVIGLAVLALIVICGNSSSHL
jgi:hypothetical protein